MKKVTVDLMLNRKVYSYVSKIELNIEGVKKNFEKQSFMRTILTKRMSTDKLNRMEKRFMRSVTTRMRDMIYRGGSVLRNPEPTKTITRSHSNYSGGVRLEDPHYEKNPKPMEIDPQTGLEIMRPFDASGKNHVLLIDNTYKDDVFFLVRGSFTSKSTPYEGRSPDMVATTTFEGKGNPQFFQNYQPKPRLIRKAEVALRDDISIILQEAEYKEYINTLPDYPEQKA